jgi:hypothetical protein
LTAYVENLYRYPLKGARGEALKIMHVRPDLGVVGDRRYGIKKNSAVKDQWSPKGMFYVCMNTPGMAAVEPIYDGNSAEVDGIRKLHPAWVDEVSSRLKLNRPPAVLDTGGEFNLADTPGSCVSFLNLASVTALEKFMGTKVDPRRFRMNVWLIGLPAFEELSWVNGFPGTRIIKVGNVPFRVDDACERCKAPEANPTSGVYDDLNIRDALDTMMEARRYRSPQRGKTCVMGFLAVPLEEGDLFQSDWVGAG